MGMERQTAIVEIPTKRGAVVVFCEPSKVAEIKAKPLEHWQRIEDGCAEAYKQLGLSTKEVSTFLNILSKARWGFSGDDAEYMPPAVRKALGGFAELIRAQTERVFPGAHAKGFLGGRPAKIPAECHAKVRLQVRELEDKGTLRMEAYAQIARKWEVKPTTVERICQDRDSAPTTPVRKKPQ